MSQQSHIVSFDDARRTTRERRFASSDSRERLGSHNRSRQATRQRSVSHAEQRTKRSAPQKSSFLDQAKASIESRKRSKNKERADKRYTRQYGASDAASSKADHAAGPRAAVYKGQMGAQHRKASRMQGVPAGHQEGKARSLAGMVSGLSRGMMMVLGVVACVVFLALFLYSPAQQYYQEIRERDRLQAEYEAIVERNEALSDEAYSLSTDAGIEDHARQEYGWVKDGETAGSVSGIDVEEESNFKANIVAGSVPAPDTWYSGFLDPLFGVK